jgi:hypothetical protein
MSRGWEHFDEVSLVGQEKEKLQLLHKVGTT